TFHLGGYSVGLHEELSRALRAERAGDRVSAVDVRHLGEGGNRSDIVAVGPEAAPDNRVPDIRLFIDRDELVLHEVLVILHPALRNPPAAEHSHGWGRAVRHITELRERAADEILAAIGALGQFGEKPGGALGA